MEPSRQQQRLQFREVGNPECTFGLATFWLQTALWQGSQWNPKQHKLLDSLCENQDFASSWVSESLLCQDPIQQEWLSYSRNKLSSNWTSFKKRQLQLLLLRTPTQYPISVVFSLPSFWNNEKHHLRPNFLPSLWLWQSRLHGTTHYEYFQWLQTP